MCAVVRFYIFCGCSGLGGYDDTHCVFGLFLVTSLISSSVVTHIPPYHLPEADRYSSISSTGGGTFFSLFTFLLYFVFFFLCFVLQLSLPLFSGRREVLFFIFRRAALCAYVGLFAIFIAARLFPSTCVLNMVSSPITIQSSISSMSVVVACIKDVYDQF